MKVYLSGNVVGSYRAQNIIKVLGDSGISYSHIPYLFFNLKVKNKYLNRFVFLVLLAITVPFRFILILLSSHIVILPMNSNVVSFFDFLLGKLLKKNIITDYYISEYDTLINDRKILADNSFKAKWVLFKDRVFLKKSNAVIFLNESESFYYQNVAGVNVDVSKIHIIPLCVDYKKETFFKENYQEEKKEFNVCWWGTYIPLHGLENLIQAFFHIKNENVKLYLFGDSEEKSKSYRKMIEENGLSDRITIINNCSFANGKLANFLSENCDLAIGNFGSSEKAKTVLVNKLVDALSLGLPCLTMRTKATSELLTQNEGIILTDPDPKSIAQNIVHTVNNRVDLARIGNEGKKKYLDTFSPDAFKVKFLTLLKK